MERNGQLRAAQYASTGYEDNYFSVGPAMLETLFLVVTHLVALGVNDVSLFERTLPWDHAATALWLEEAGGKAARPDGSPYRVDEWQRKGLIGAASPQLWDHMAEHLAEIPFD